MRAPRDSTILITSIIFMMAGMGIFLIALGLMLHDSTKACPLKPPPAELPCPR